MKKDIKEFCRKLRLAEEFHTGSDEEVEQSDLPLVKNKSKYNGRRHRDRTLDTYIDFLETFQIDKVSTKRSNLTRREREALKSLGSKEDIIITTADKGGTVVVLAKTYYQNKVEEMLKDTKQYQQVDSDTDSKTFKKIKTLISRYSEELLDKEYDYLTNFDFKPAQFYGLPKVHKSLKIEEAVKSQNCKYIEITDCNDLPFRPICGSPSCVTSRLSNMLDIILKPMCVKVRSYIKDSTHFLSTLPKEISENSSLVTFDVVSLYNNIQINLALEAVSHWIDTHPEMLVRDFSKSFIIEGLSLVLNNNTMCFNDTVYKQIRGVAMGTRVAPSVASLTLGFLEKKLYSDIEDAFNEQIKTYFMENWHRFLDDCFITWPNNFGDIDRVKDILNALHPDIKFTLDSSPTELPFLDVLVKKQGNILTTDIYYKPTDSRRYLNFKSCHPSHTKRNIPYNLARRIALIVEDKTVRKVRLDELTQSLIDCDYPPKLCSDASNKFSSVDSKDLRKNTRKDRDHNILCFVNTYNPNNFQFYEIIKNSINMLEGSEKMVEVMQNRTIINSLRQPQNLRRILTSSKFKGSNSGEIKKVTKCGRPRCKLCRQIVEGIEFKLQDGRSIKPNTNMTCKSDWVCYLLKCANCTRTYIGSTKNPLNLRINLHRDHAKNPFKKDAIGCSRHFANCCKEEEIKFQVFPFNQLTFDQSELRLHSVENIWINRLKPPLNSMLNV